MYDKPLQHSSTAHTFGRGTAGCTHAAYNETPTIYVINGDPAKRRSLETTVRDARWEVRGFSSAAAFFSCHRSLTPACLVVDTVLPDCCGLELQKRLNQDEPGLSVIFIMERPDVSIAVHAIKAGAVEVLTNPIDSALLISTLQDAIIRSKTALVERSELEILRKDYACLTSREREVMMLVASGLLNKQVGAELGISEITVKAHRGQAMRKMKATSFADLVKKAAFLCRMSR